MAVRMPGASAELDLQIFRDQEIARHLIRRCTSRMSPAVRVPVFFRKWRSLESLLASKLRECEILTMIPEHRKLPSFLRKKTQFYR